MCPKRVQQWFEWLDHNPSWRLHLNLVLSICDCPRRILKPSVECLSLSDLLSSILTVRDLPFLSASCSFPSWCLTQSPQCVCRQHVRCSGYHLQQMSYPAENRKKEIFGTAISWKHFKWIKKIEADFEFSRIWAPNLKNNLEDATLIISKCFPIYIRKVT